MHISELTPADLVAYKRLMLHAFNTSADAFTNTASDRADAEDAWWLKRIADPSGLSIAFGAFMGSVLVGSVTVEFSRKPKIKHRASILGMFVREEARRGGVARLLLQRALAHASDRDSVLTVGLSVTEGNDAAIALYRSCGFVVIGTEPMAIATSNGYRGKVYMWRKLARADQAVDNDSACI